MPDLAPQLPFIPEYITVHLGRPDSDAPNVQVPFTDYIKSVASSEIYPTWPDSALRANIYSQISFALNRIYTEWYRSKGYDFDITNSTQFDQAYQHQRDIFDNISRIVDELFNDYVVKQGSVEPYFTAFCNGTTAQCEGLSQWGTVDLANKGYTPYEILTYYYGNDINIVRNAPVEQVLQSYPGIPLRTGSTGNNVRTIQLQLNRIRRNFPSIPPITRVDGIFGVETDKAVRAFQKTFNLKQDGIVGKATWYKIKEIYNAVKQLSELASEGISLEEVTPIFPVEPLEKGDYGMPVQVVQYYISVIGYFNAAVPVIPVDGVFGTTTENAVIQFQNQYGLPATGIIDLATWTRMEEIYKGIVSTIPEDIYGGRSPIYPGEVLKRGAENDNILLIQTWLTALRAIYPNLPYVNTTGFFGDQTEAAVKAFQKIFGLPQTGTVGPITWQKIADEYDDLRGIPARQ